MSNDKKAVLERFARYVFPTETQKLRDDLTESIVEMSLYECGNRGGDIAKIGNIAKYSLRIEIERFILEGAIQRLIEKKSVLEKVNHYFLINPRRKEFGKILAERKQFLRKMETEYIHELKKRYGKLGEEQETLTLEFLYEFLSSLYSNEGKFVSATLRLLPNDVEYITNYKPPAALMADLLSKVKDKSLARSIGVAISSLFRSRKFSRFLNTTAQNFLFFEILNLDPECRFLEKEIFSKKTLFLDTNFLIALLLQSDHRHRIAVQTAFFSRKIGVNLTITKRTEEEFKVELNHAYARFKQLNCNKLDILLSLDDEFIVSYALQKQRNRSLSWLDFYYRLKPIRTVLNRHGITLFDDGDLALKISKSDIFPETTGYVLTCASKMTRKIKAAHVAEHDAYHILLIRKMRKNQLPSMLGPQFWFLTFDYSLLCVDKAVNKLLGNKYEAPSNMMGLAWLELITPYSGADVSEVVLSKAFAGLMTGPFSAMPTRLSLGDLLQIQNPKINLSNHTAEEIHEILHDELVQQYLRKVREAEFLHLPKRTEYRKKLTEQAEKKSNIILKRRVSEEIRWRRFSGIFSAILILFGIYCVLISNFLGAFLLFVVAGFLVAVAVGYEKIEMEMRKLRLQIKRVHS